MIWIIKPVKPEVAIFNAYKVINNLKYEQFGSKPKNLSLGIMRKF